MKYLELLKLMVEEPVLIFSAIEKASEVGVMDRMSISNWIDKSDFRTRPEQVIARLDLSPLVSELADFQAFSRNSELIFPSNYPKEPTLFDWVVVEIRELDAAAQKPFLAYLERKKTFGAEMMLTSVERSNWCQICGVLESKCRRDFQTFQRA